MQNVATGISNFIHNNEKFDFSTSKIHEFEKEIKAAAPAHAEPVKAALKNMQRIFQVSPTPKVMGVLMEKELNSAYTIAGTPKKSFMKMHGGDLGGEQMAEAVYQRAMHINTLATERSMKIYELQNTKAPKLAFSKTDREEVMLVLQNKLPNYATLFGSVDMCECKDCRSVYSAAAYLVDLLPLPEQKRTQSGG